MTYSAAGVSSPICPGFRVDLTDECGYGTTENRTSVRDLFATNLYLFGHGPPTTHLGTITMIPFRTCRLFAFLLMSLAWLQLAVSLSFAADSPNGVSPHKAQSAFPDLKWSGWSPVSDDGKAQPLRPIVLTHAGDGSNRIFVATQRGVIHVFENRQSVKKTKVFLDIELKVVYNDKKNEEGLLGFAFHPKYRQNGYFFIYYTARDAEHTSVISRFRVSKDDPNRADAKFEAEVMRIKQPLSLIHI